MDKPIPFNVPAVTGREIGYLQDVMARRTFSGDGFYTKACHAWLENHYGCPRALLTTSCTHALEMAALLLDIQPGDEVIMPSYTFVSTANAFVLRGARIAFVDVDPLTMNLDVDCVRAAINPATRAVVVVHYAGFSCDMDALLALCGDRGLILVEDAAQAIGGSYRGRRLGTFGALACLSFHETKNLQCGEGGALLINDRNLAERAEIIREKGTDRSRFFRGQVDKYTWQSIGSSYLPSELNAAFLLAQLQSMEEIQDSRIEVWNQYRLALAPLQGDGLLEIPSAPGANTPNGHLFWIKLANIEQRGRFIESMRQKGVFTVFHYVPLHSAPAGRQAGYFAGEDRWTTRESERLVRLPLYYRMSETELSRVVAEVGAAVRSLPRNSAQ